MRKALFAFLLLFANTFMLMQSANAGSLTAGNIFSMMKGTTTIDQGGAIHSQARNIYSLGGGMTTFQGKRVSLMSADPPGFSAGCGGISWHFGGFSFISVDEIRQLVEAVAQASLGIAVDLAMQTLCPQCYAVMAKLRDIANQMRNAAADACKIAKNFGKLLQKEGIFADSDKTMKDCAEVKAADGADNSFLQSLSSGACKLLGDASDAMTEYGGKIESFLSGGNAAVPGKTPGKQAIEQVGNRTYKALGALGYKDGVAKDLLLSYLGMTIVPAKDATDCTGTFINLRGSAENDSGDAIAQKVLEANKPKPTEAKVTDPSKNPTPTDTPPATPAKLEGTAAPKAPQVCFAPPITKDLKQIGIQMVCGFAPRSDLLTFAKAFYTTSSSPDVGVAIDKLGTTTLGELCNVKRLYSSADTVGAEVKDTADQWLYHCEKGESAECLKPSMKRISELTQADLESGRYTGLAWMILDALYRGVTAVANNEASLPKDTIAVLQGSGYPLYRLINLAAVYPGTADELLQAYGAVIAVQYVLDTLEQVSRVGAQANIQMQSIGGIAPGEIAQMRSEISQMFVSMGVVRDQTLRRMAEKRALVDSIVQVNRALQAEVISRGLGDNNNLAISLKKQVPPTKP